MVAEVEVAEVEVAEVVVARRRRLHGRDAVQMAVPSRDTGSNSPALSVVIAIDLLDPGLLALDSP